MKLSRCIVLAAPLLLLPGSVRLTAQDPRVPQWDPKQELPHFDPVPWWKKDEAQQRKRLEEQLTLLYFLALAGGVVAAGWVLTKLYDLLRGTREAAGGSIVSIVLRKIFGGRARHTHMTCPSCGFLSPLSQRRCVCGCLLAKK
jgi:hypothetical protein